MTTIEPLIAYHGDPATKQKYLDRVAGHRMADELIRLLEAA